MVIVLDKHKKPLGFTTERRARKLMEVRRACMYRRFPAVIIVKDVDSRILENLPTYRIKIDPGAKHTGISVVCNETNEAMFFMQIEHRGDMVKKNLSTRHDARKNRRNRETWYRRPKWKVHKKDDNFRVVSRRKEGWLPPSVKSTADNVIHWVKKLKKFINITECSFEAVRFDSQLMDNPDISGEEYQHGTLFGYELKEYLLETFGHQCQYCGGTSGDSTLEWEHMKPRSKGGSDSVKNASLACSVCNRDKGNRDLKEYLDVLKTRSPKSKKEKDLNDARIKHINDILENGKIHKSNRYSAWVNANRRYIEKELFEIFKEVECSSGGRTKYNRTKLGLPKDHHYDALCVGTVPEGGYKNRTNGYVLHAKATGRGTRLRGQINKCGIITVKYKKSPKRVFGFQTGDMVTADIPKGKYKGRYTGKVMVRSSGYFDIKVSGRRVVSSHSNCKIVQNFDGYEYRYEKSQQGAIPLGY